MNSKLALYPAAAIAFNLGALSLTWLVVFAWKIGFEYDPLSNVRLHSLGFLANGLTGALAIGVSYIGLFVAIPRLSQLRSHWKLIYLTPVLACLFDFLWDFVHVLIWRS